MKTFLSYIRDYGMFVLIFVLLINAMQNCSQSRTIDRNTKIIYSNVAKIDSINKVLSGGEYSVRQAELSIMLEIQRLQTAKLILYDWNTVVRTVVRPDDRMNEYDVQIANLTKELQTLRLNKSANGK